MVTNNQYAHTIIGNAEQKVVWESFEVYSSEIAFQGFVSFGRFAGLLEA